MQKTSLKLSIFSGMALILIAILSIFGFGKLNSVNAANNLGEIKVSIITVDNATNGFISKRANIDNLDKEDTPITLDSYTELVGAEVKYEEGKYYLYLLGSTTGIEADTGTTNKFSGIRFNDKPGVAYKSDYLNKVIWFESKNLELDIYNIRETTVSSNTVTSFSFMYNGVEYNKEHSGVLANDATVSIEDLPFLGTLEGKISSISSNNSTAKWKSTKSFETHEALLIQVGSANDSEKTFDITQHRMELNGEAIDSMGVIQNSRGSYFYKEYHAIPARIADECGINAVAKTAKVYGSTNYLNVLEGYYKFSVNYLINSLTQPQANFNFYLMTSNTYANTDEILTFYNTKTVDAPVTDEKITKYHNFSHNNINNTKLLDTVNPTKLEGDVIVDSTGLQYNGKTYTEIFSLPQDGDTPYVVDDLYAAYEQGFGANNTKGIIYRDGVTKKWMFADRLLYPTITFNPEKYAISFKKTWYNTTSSGEFDFATKNRGLYGTVTLQTTSASGVKSSQSFDIARKTSELVGTIANVSIALNSESKIYELVSLTYEGTPYTATNGIVTIDDVQYYYNQISQKVCKYDMDAPFIAQYTFEELGEYEFMQKYKLKISENVYYITDSISASTSISDKNEKLSISGYQSTYRLNGTTTSYLRNENYISDFSYLVATPVYKKSESIANATARPDASGVAITETDDHNYYKVTIGTRIYYIDKTKITTTNQAPVNLRYFATPNNTTMEGRNFLWYLHVDNTGNIATYDYSNSKSFSAAGLYVVFLSFNDTSVSNNCCQQVIAFRITNSQPEVSIQTTDLNDISSLTEKGESPIASNSFTNKNVFIQWLNNDVFNSKIYATYTQYDFNGRVVKHDNVNGVIYYRNSSQIKNENTTLFTQNGRYVVNIFYTNTGSSISRSFVIDRTNIDGIKAISVNSLGKIYGSDQAGSTLAEATLSDQTNFNLVVSSSFAWTWNSKESGAAIYAKYYYSNISAKSSYNLSSIENNGDLWLLANGEFGELLTGTDYAHTPLSTINSSSTEAVYWKSAKFDSSQIISTNCMAILVLRDEAGNTASFVTIYDSIAPQIMQRKAGGEATTSTLISGTTEFIWGSHKAIGVGLTSGPLKIGDTFSEILSNSSQTISFDSETYALSSNICEQIRNTFIEHGTNNLYYTLPIKNVSIKMDYDSRTYTLAPQKVGNWINTSCFVVLKEENGEMKTYLASQQDGSGRISTAPISLEDRSIQVRLTDTDKLNNKTTIIKNISLDQSDGRIFSHSGTVDNSAITDTTIESTNMSSANRQQVWVGYSTNRDYLTFSFLQQMESSTFRVESIKLDYYELNPNLTTVYNETTGQYEPNPNYPYNTVPIKRTLYSINPTDTVMKNITWNDRTIADREGYSGTYMQSNEINVASNGLTAPGKYVFIRKYETDVSSLDPEISKYDKTYFEYTVYVDRNGVITDDMSLNLGTKNFFDNYDESETFKEFKNFSNQKRAPLDFQENFTYTAGSARFSQPKTTLPSTDMVPAEFALKILGGIAYKYYYQNENGSILDANGNKYNVGTQNSANLMVLVQQFDPTLSNKLSSQCLYSSAVTRVHSDPNFTSAPISMLASQKFAANLIYRVFVMDLSNINMQLFDSDFDEPWAKSILKIWDKNIYNTTFTPNVAVFSFTLNKERIVSSALIKNPNVDTYTSINKTSLLVDGNINDYYYTQNNNVIFTFSDTTYEYKAKIQYKDWTLTRTVRSLIDGNMETTSTSSINPKNTEIRTYEQNNDEANRLIFSENEINRIKGLVDNTNSSMRFSTKDEDAGILYYRVKLNGTSDDRYTYYIILPASPSDGINDCIYSLNLSYLTDNSYYGDATDIYSTTMLAYIDKTAPYKNIYNLINNDSFLTNLQSNQKADMIANLNNPNYKFLQYYAFAVGTSYSPDKNVDSSERIDYYYYKAVDQKYINGSQNSNQVVIPENEDFNNSNNKFDETTMSKRLYDGEPLRASVDGTGYYDIVEVDKAGNHRVYTIYLNGDEGGIEMGAKATNENSDEFDYTFLTSFNGDTPFYNISYVSNDVIKEIYSKTGMIDYSTIQNIPSISSSTFDINKLSIKDEWYLIRYRLVNGATNAEWQTIVVAPQVYSTITGETYNTKEENITLLNEFIEESIANGKQSTGARLEIELLNRGGNNLRFYLLSPGVGLSIADLSPTLVGNRYFTVTIPADTYSTNYSDFRVTQNSVAISCDHNSPATYISDIALNRNAPINLRFLLGNYRYAISFKDNFGRSYEFIYPTTEGIVNELVFEEGTTPKYVDGVLYSSNTATFKYTTGTRDRISIKIVDLDTNETVVNLLNMPYTSTTDENNLKDKLSLDENKIYMLESLNMANSVVSINFNAIKNRHLYYEITLLDIDNNTHVRNFAIYTHAPTITLTDNVGIEIFNKDSSDNITSKTVVVRYSTNTAFEFDPIIKLFDGTTTTQIPSSYQIKNAGDYKIFIENELGTVNSFSINFTIKPATTDIYSVYFGDELLSAHSVKYVYEKDTSAKLIDSYFFLSGTINAWNDIKILPSEDKDLTTELVETIGNTKIYKIFGSVYEDYFAITQIFPVANNHLTTFNVYTTTDLIEYTNSPVGSGDHQYTIEPATGKTIYAKIHWDTSEAGFKNFIYAKIWYNTVYMGTFSEDVILTKSGQYRIQIFDFVGQQHRFGTQSKEEFTLTILNNVNFYINNSTPIENQTFNDAVTLTLVNTDKYAWRSGGFITVLKNNQEFTNYETNGTSWTFREAGYYNIYIETPIASNTATPIRISGTAHFTILDKNESKTVYDFARISGYSVTKVERIDYNSDLAELINLVKENYSSIDADSSYAEQVINSFKQYNEKLITDNNITTVTELATYLESINTNSLLYTYTDMTDTLKSMLETDALQSFKITPDNLGIGRYKIHVRVESNELSTFLSYSYEIWINNEEPTINSSRAFGSSSTASFTISYNPSIIYNQVGNSYIKINDVVVETITSENAADNTIRTYRVSTPGTYLIQVYSQSGSLISSQRITINVPLNTAAIILIVVAVLVVVGIIVVFILLRTKMKVK